MKQRMLYFALLTVFSALVVEQCFSLPARAQPQPVKGVAPESSEPAPVKGAPIIEKPIVAILGDNLPEEPAPAINSELPAEEPKKEVDKTVPKAEPEKVTEASPPPPPEPTTEKPNSKVLEGPVFKKGYPTTFYGPEGKLYKLPLSEAELEYLSNYGQSRRPKPRLHYLESGITANTQNVRLVYFYMHIGNFLMYIGDDFGKTGKDD